MGFSQEEIQNMVQRVVNGESKNSVVEDTCVPSTSLDYMLIEHGHSELAAPSNVKRYNEKHKKTCAKETLTESEIEIADKMGLDKKVVLKCKRGEYSGPKGMTTEDFVRFALMSPDHSPEDGMALAFLKLDIATDPRLRAVEILERRLGIKS